MDLEIPNELNFLCESYKIISIIGTGTFSTCYKAVDIKSGVEVALKVITRTTSPNRILDELKILHELGGNHFVFH